MNVLLLFLPLALSATITQNWMVNQTVVPDSSVHYVALQGIAAANDGMVVVTGIGVRENFLLGYDNKGKLAYTKPWDKSGAGYTNIAQDVRTLKTGTYVIGFALFRSINTKTGAFNWLAELPLLGDCAAQDMKIDDMTLDPAHPDTYAYVAGSCQKQNQPQKIFVDKYNIKDGSYLTRIALWDVADFLSSADDCKNVVLTVNLEVDQTTKDRLYIGAKCKSTGLLVYDVGAKKKQWSTLLKEDSYIKPKQYLVLNQGSLFTLAQKKVTKWALNPKSTSAPIGKAMWQQSVQQASATINDYTMDCEGNTCWVASTENSQENYLMAFATDKGTKLATKDFFSSVTPQGGLEIESMTALADGKTVYIVTQDMRTGFPVGWTFSFTM